MTCRRHGLDWGFATLELNKKFSVKHGNDVQVVGRQAILYICIQIEPAQATPVRGCLQEGEHVVSGRSVNEFGSDGAVFVCLE